MKKNRKTDAADWALFETCCEKLGDNFPKFSADDVKRHYLSIQERIKQETKMFVYLPLEEYETICYFPGFDVFLGLSPTPSFQFRILGFPSDYVKDLRYRAAYSYLHAMSLLNRRVVKLLFRVSPK